MTVWPVFLSWHEYISVCKICSMNTDSFVESLSCSCLSCLLVNGYYLCHLHQSSLKCYTFYIHLMLYLLQMKPRRLIFALYRSRAQGQICLEVLWVHYLHLDDAKHQTEAHIKVCQLPSHPFPWRWQCCACVSSIVSWSKKANCILHFLCRNLCCCPSSGRHQRWYFGVIAHTQWLFQETRYKNSIIIFFLF